MRQVNDAYDPGFEPQPTPPRRGWPRPQPETDRRPPRDPAPSRLAYRLQRLWLTPVFRKLVRVGAPAFVLALTAGLWLSDEDRRASLTGGLTGMVEQVQNRDQFMVHSMDITGASEPVDKALRMMLPVDLPASSFDIDLDGLREDIRALDAVADVDLRIRPGGVLSASVSEREPALLWRHAQGIDLLDAEGNRVASVNARAMRPDLPLIAGAGGDSAAAEALTVIAATGPLMPRLRGLQRMGARRWDVVLDRGQRIMLPAEAPVAALERAIALSQAQDLLGRDVSVLDLRDGSRPVVRMGLGARNAIRRALGRPELDAQGREIDASKGQG